MPDVILPALDEAAAIHVVLASLPSGYRAIVVDNGSRDGTADIARAHGATVVVEPRRGFGAACHAGLRAAESEIVCFMDCDGSLSGADLPPLVALVRDGRADLVLGARCAQRGAWPWHARTANRAIAAMIRIRTGVVLSDLGPMRAARRAELIALHIQDRRSGWPLEMVLRAASHGWQIDERPVGYEHRIGRSKVTGTVKGTIRAAYDMSRVTLRVIA